ncbi:class I SAM-dependent methyltransferase [Stenotrophomonas sp. LARHCG68]
MQIAALAPSGAALATLITQEIHPGIGQVLELGPGTGAFTRAVLARGVRPSALTLVEYEDVFAQLLNDRFPEATVIQMDASKLIGDIRFRQENFGAVISGLPLLSMRPRTVLRILAGSFGALGQGGVFYQFTYGFSCPISRKILDRLGLKATRIGGTVANFPPAWVYRISRRSMPRNLGINSSPVNEAKCINSRLENGDLQGI